MQFRHLVGALLLANLLPAQGLIPRPMVHLRSPASDITASTSHPSTLRIGDNTLQIRPVGLRERTALSILADDLAQRGHLATDVVKETPVTAEPATPLLELLPVRLAFLLLAAAGAVNFGGGLLSSYIQASINHPGPVAAITAGVVGGSGDLNAQLLVERCGGLERVDWMRTASIVSYQALYGLHLRLQWYPTLDALYPGTGLKTAAFKVVTDLGLHFPTCYALTFLVWTSLFRGDSWSQTRQRIKEKFVKMVTTAWCLWIPCQFITFAVVPPPLRILWAKTVGLVWSTIVSLLTMQPAQSPGLKFSRVVDVGQSRRGTVLTLTPRARRTGRLVSPA